MITASRKITACAFIAIVLGVGALSLQSLGDYGPAQGLDPVAGELARAEPTEPQEDWTGADSGA